MLLEVFPNRKREPSVLTAANVCPWAAMLAIFCSCRAPCFLRELGMLEPEAEGERGEERERENGKGRGEREGTEERERRGRDRGERGEEGREERE